MITSTIQNYSNRILNMNITKQLLASFFAVLIISFPLRAQNCTLTCSKVVHVTCYGSNSGSVTCTIGNDSKTPFNYSCNGGPVKSTNSNSFSCSGLSVGSCTIKVTDAGNYSAT